LDTDTCIYRLWCYETTTCQAPACSTECVSVEGWSSAGIRMICILKVEDLLSQYLYTQIHY